MIWWFQITLLPLPANLAYEETTHHTHIDRPGAHSTGPHCIHRIGRQLLDTHADRWRGAHAHFPAGTDREDDCRPTGWRGQQLHPHR